ncbi:cytochrome P450 [Aspergillus filifer]
MWLIEYSNAIVILFLCVLYNALVRREWIVHIALSTFVYPVKREDAHSIRGPSWKWIDGQCLDKFLRGREVSQKWRQYGPVYRIWSGCKPEIVITRPEDVRAFHSDSKSHAKSKSSNGGWLFHQLLGDCMGLVNGEPWKELRAQYNAAFVHRAVVDITPFLVHRADEYVKQIQQVDTGVIQLCAADAFSRYPFMATAEYLYGPLTESEKEELWSLGQRSLALMEKVLAGGVFRYKASRWLKPQVHKQLAAFEKDWTQFNERIVQTRGVSGPSSPAMVQAWEAAVGKGKVSKKQMVQTLSEMLFANLDVSTHTLSWLIIFLARHPDIQNELREEVRENKDCLVELCGKKDSLLHHCLWESIRLRPFTAFTIPESSPQTKLLGGYIVPPHTTVVVDTMSINHNPEFWGGDCDDFNPHRLEKLSTTDLRYNLFAFGFGSRKCLGQHFGEAMMKSVACQLLAQYDLGMPFDGNKTDLDSAHLKDTWVPISDVEITLTPLGAF